MTVYELNAWSQPLNTAFTLEDCLFGAFKLTKNSDPDEYSYSGCAIILDSCSLFHSQILFGVKILLFLK